MLERVVSQIDDAELNRRWSAAKQVMDQYGVDALVLQNSNDFQGGYIRWFAGVPARWGYQRSLVFFGPDDLALVEQGGVGGRRTPDPADPIYKSLKEVRTSPSYPSVHFTGETDANLIADILSERGVKRIGWVNPAGAYFTFGRGLERRMSDCTFIDVTEGIDQHKAIKSPFEQAAIRATADLQDQVMRKMAEFIQPGVRDNEILAYAQYQCECLGAEQGIYLGTSSPPGTASILRLPALQGRKIQKGDVFALVIESNGPGGYYTEIGRSLSIGKPPEDLVAATQIAADAQAYVADLLRPGAHYKDIYLAHAEYMESRGLPREKRLFAHSQGYDAVERPLVRDDENMAVQENTNLSCHPGHIDAKVNALVCDNFIVGPDGAVKIHHLPPDIIVI